ncbi:sodium:solute symporter family protein [Coraliomargarita parva]|uniref:sodium:solute symporter family protein n=1 Tax=Coraliomargarita parva TaxID=3014050 RepID=UPI0022B4D2CA|nr:sodium:solute symporter family protein [Coraliomargarita parva]
MSAYVIWAAIFLAGYLIWLLVLALRSARTRSTDLDTFFLADKSVGFLASVFTFWATYFSAVALIGAAGYYYMHGVGNFYFAALGYIMLALITGTVGRRLWRLSRRYPEIRSPIQLYLRHFRSPGLELLFVLVTLFCMVPYMAAQITGFARLMEGAMDLPYVWTAAAALAVIYFYSESGGLKNIVSTDIVQSLMTIVGCIGVVITFLWAYWAWDLGSFVREVDAVSDPSLWSLSGPNGFYNPVLIVSLALLISLGAVPMAHNAQRYMIVKDEVYLRRLMWLFPVLGVFVTMVACVLGLGGAVHFPGLASGDQVIGAITATVPPVIGAMATVGILAATMSTADSILLSVGFIVSEQWYRGKKGSGASVLRLNRWCTLAIAIFAFIASIRPELVSDLAFNAFGGMLQLAPVMLAGLYEWKVGRNWAFASVLSGLTVLFIGNTNLYGHLAPEYLPHYLAAFLSGLAVLGVGRLLVAYRALPVYERAPVGLRAAQTVK